LSLPGRSTLQHGHGLFVLQQHDEPSSGTGFDDQHHRSSTGRHARAGPPPGYAHLSLALVDAVYSIRSRYSAVERVVAAYGKASDTECQPLAARSDPGFREQGLDCLLNRAGTLHGEALAGLLFAGSRSRTAGRLKADVCVEAAQRLQAMSVTAIPDLHERADDAGVRHAWTGVHGLGWVTWQYFCSLVGINHLKPDVMLTRFAAQTLGRNVSAAETDALLSRACEELQPDHPGLR
jgi:hypothetical protein